MPERNSTKSAQRKPLLCRLNRHRWHTETTPDGGRYQRCIRCGKDKDEDLNISVDIF
ncbi:hypothetical protein [Leifsonia xyli]|uniref:hypothetical protein n=1 Tax=Leifsonia xyli TaxID=1575 RepID=UPI000AA6FB4E